VACRKEVSSTSSFPTAHVVASPFTCKHVDKKRAVEGLGAAFKNAWEGGEPTCLDAAHGLRSTSGIGSGGAGHATGHADAEVAREEPVAGIRVAGQAAVRRLPVESDLSASKGSVRFTRCLVAGQRSAYANAPPQQCARSVCYHSGRKINTREIIGVFHRISAFVYFFWLKDLHGGRFHQEAHHAPVRRRLPEAQLLQQLCRSRKRRRRGHPDSQTPAHTYQKPTGSRWAR
jgi:hypothetical protein